MVWYGISARTLGLFACPSLAELPQLYLTLQTRTLRHLGIHRSALPFQLDGLQFQLSCYPDFPDYNAGAKS